MVEILETILVNFQFNPMLFFFFFNLKKFTWMYFKKMHRKQIKLNTLRDVSIRVAQCTRRYKQRKYLQKILTYIIGIFKFNLLTYNYLYGVVFHKKHFCKSEIHRWLKYNNTQNSIADGCSDKQNIWNKFIPLNIFYTFSNI